MMASLLGEKKQKQSQHLPLMDISTSASFPDRSLALVPGSSDRSLALVPLMSEPQLPKLSMVPLGLAMASGVGIREHLEGFPGQCRRPARACLGKGTVVLE